MTTEELNPFPTMDEIEDTEAPKIKMRPLYFVMDGEQVTDVSFDDTGHLYQDVPEDYDLDYWKEFFELRTHRLTFVDGLLVATHSQIVYNGANGVTEEEVEARIADALKEQKEEFLSILDGYSKKRTAKQK